AAGSLPERLWRAAHWRSTSAAPFLVAAQGGGDSRQIGRGAGGGGEGQPPSGAAPQPGGQGTAGEKGGGAGRGACAGGGAGSNQLSRYGSATTTPIAITVSKSKARNQPAEKMLRPATSSNSSSSSWKVSCSMLMFFGPPCRNVCPRMSKGSSKSTPC